MNDGFSPFAFKDSEVLILGSFPSVISRKNGFYYGNPQNRFWKTLGRFFGEEVPVTTEEKKNFLTVHKIALYDVYSKSSVKGSADADLNDQTTVKADMGELLESMPNLKGILCNGKKAYDVFTENYGGYAKITYRLPSTSGANPTYDYNEWEKILKSLLR